MVVLSFDVGQKNLAYCKTRPETHEILEWKVVTLPSATCVSSVVRALEREFPQNHELTQVIVEKQPSRNVKMRIIETILLSYFATIGVPTVSFSAKHKLGAVGKTMKGKTNYTMRKKMSVVMCRTYLAKGPEEQQRMFEQSKKKDDLADCLLQYLAYTKYDLGSLTTSVVDLFGETPIHNPNDAA
jgi:hypothetical protein